MELESNLLLSQAKQLYHITPLWEITTGYSGDSIFEAESGLRRRILRVAEFSNKKEAHVEFETRWTEYLALRMEGIAKPVRSVNNRLYEVAGAGGKTSEHRQTGKAQQQVGAGREGSQRRGQQGTGEENGKDAQGQAHRTDGNAHRRQQTGAGGTECGPGQSTDGAGRGRKLCWHE